MGLSFSRLAPWAVAIGILGACSGDDAPPVAGPGTGNGGSGGRGGSSGSSTGGSAGKGGDASAGSAGTSGSAGSGGGSGSGASGGSVADAGPGGTNGAAGAPDASGSDTGTPDGSAGSDGAAGSSACGAPPAAPPSCDGLARSCGLSGNEACCATRCVPGGSFVLGRAPGAPDDACPVDSPPFACDSDEQPVAANVRPFFLDRFEITVGRFRKFVAASVAGYRPAAGSGKHGYLNGGAEAGWNGSWPLPATLGEWSTALNRGTWTAVPGANENKPITSITWYAAQAFCIYDGGFLPTEAEWELAASGGEERIFPWSVPPGSLLFDAAHSSLACCNAPREVGLKPPGDGRWGHADLAGNVFEWTLDVYQSQFPINPCNDCVVDRPEVFRTARGGDYDNGSHPRAVAREMGQVDARDAYVGARCARRAATADGG